MKVGGGEWGGYDWAEAFGREDYEILGEEHYWGRRTVFSVGDIFLVWSLGGLLQGCTRLLGVLGSGARNPHGILELGSRTGSVPSWQGGRFSFGQSLGRAAERTTRDRNLASDRGIFIYVFS
jgi:hypothetical protein